MGISLLLFVVVIILAVRIKFQIIYVLLNQIQSLKSCGPDKGKGIFDL